MADDQNEESHLVRFPHLEVEAEERRVKEIAREIEDFGRALKGGDHLASSGRAKQALMQQRAHNQMLERQLAIRQDHQRLLVQERARGQELEQQLAVCGDKWKLLAQLRARNRELERQLAAREDDEKLLAQEQARTEELERRLTAREGVAADSRRTTTANALAKFTSRLPGRPAEELATDPLPTSAVAAIPEQYNSRTGLARRRVPEAPRNFEAASLVAQARLLLDQGNIIAARSVLGRASEGGSALALYLLAETYDPAILSDWGVFCRHGDVTKAQKLYAEAVGAGVHEAKYRLSALRARSMQDIIGRLTKYVVDR
ncbi:MAG: hypothetical protein JO339_00705 [Alphaproteobacteria bacterium]|nr:hypothetical protein [Alphaproteobacteria bacterium]